MPPAGQPAPPVFERIFRNARFAQGGNALFEGTVRGNPRPTISWTRQGRPIHDSNKYQLKYEPTSGEVSLMISRIGPGDEGEYTCLAKNQYGEAICTVYIQPEAAYLQQQQQQYQQQSMQQQSMQRRMMSQQQAVHFHQEMSTTDSAGHTAVSSAVDRQFQAAPFAAPFGQPSVQQQTEEFRVDTFEYRLIRETEFRESLTRRYAGETETETEVETETESRQPGPLSPPQVQTKPRATKVSQHGDATFQARLVGNPKPKVTWFHNGARVRPGPRAAASHSNSNAVLRLRSVQPEDGGHYTMLAENAAGCVVSSAFLAVEPVADAARQGVTTTQRVEKSAFSAVEETTTTEDRSLAPTFLRVPTDKETQEGKMVRLECRTSGKPSPEVFWYINGLPIVNDATHKIMVNEAGSHALMITNATQRDSGVLTCVAKNKNGQTQFQVNLNVLEREQVIAPKFVERFQTVHVRPGEPVSLSCRAVGAPTPRITWQKDGAPIDSSASVRIVTDGGASMLDIPCVRPEDGAWYQCTAQNAAGSTATRAKLYVDTGPAQPAGEPWRLQLPKPTRVIEPEPPQESEIIHLRHVERSRPKPQRAEQERPVQPPQFTHPLRDAAVSEGDRILLEAKLVPLGDPTMRIEWYIDGQPLPASSRATLTDKFGYVSLSLLSVVRQDAGSYTCRAVNQAGSADTTCTVSVGPRSTIETTSQHPESLQSIQQLEDNSRYVLKSASMEMHSMRPTFVHELRDVTGVAEGSYAHFEAQINPVSDPFMRIEWFKDGRPITASSRISTINNFGYVALNINQLRPEDSGVYTVRATNKAGDSSSKATLTVSVPDPGVTGDLGIPEQQRYIQSVEQLEAYKQSIYQQVTSELEEKTEPPNFTQPIRDAPAVPENGTAHFEARLEPMGDATMTIHWFKDGRPLEASSRMTTFFNFGYVSLTIKQVSVFDTGSYTCVARNAAGQTQCEARLQCVGKQDVLHESHMESMQKIQYLEDSSRYQRTIEEDVTVTKMPPKFLGPIKGTNIIREDQKAHFEARLEPQNDPTMKTEWFHNGQPLTSANRIQTFLNFGYVALDISAVKPEDAGTYTLVATNALGRDQQQTQMKVEARSAIDTTSIHRAVVDKTDRLERSKFQEPHYDVGDYCKSKPHFTEPLRDPAPQAEGRGVHLECRLEPLNDPTMRVEWFQNGRPVTIGSRFRTYSEFGFVALDVLDLTAADAGEYTVRATNQLGSAHTSAMVRVSSRADVDTETQHEGALDQIQYLESGARLTRQMTTEFAVDQAPTFTKPLRNIETAEGTNVHLECRLQPVGDNSMKVEWFVNDQPLKIGHRFRPAYDFDYVALDLLSVYPVDSGMYTCRASNRLGQAVTSASVRIIAKKDLYTDHPASMERIQYIEDSSRYQRKEWADEMVQIKPKFITQLKHQENLQENQTAHFEAKLEPVADANLHVEWLKDGKPITVGHRHRPLHDFGYVALDIVGLIEEDNGVYTCRATNNQGVDETSAILRCSSSTKILTSTQHETGLERVQYLEDRSRLTRSETLEEVTTQAPVFTTSLSSVAIREGQRAHFESRLIPVSDPTMTVQWFHNGRPVKAGSRFMETNSFGFVALDIMYAYPEDQGTYTCKATNALGEAVTQATLSCTTKGAIDQGSLHDQALDKLRYLEQKARPAADAEESTAQAPVFTQPVRDVRLVEGQPLHFEARLIPVGDSKLRVEWFKNGVPLQQANRISTLHDFGFVALDMKYTQEEDSGTYTCRATNELGQAATSATAVIQSKDSLLMETQNASSLEKLRQLEGRAFTRTEIEETVVTEKPRFVTELTGPTSLVEGQSAHMEARIEPYPDPDMKVEWFHNGQAIGTGHRFRTVNDFGFIALDVLSAYPEDSGEYTARITNRLGTATSTINIKIQARASLIQETQHPAAMQKITYLESDRRREVHEEAVALEKPVFGRPLRNAALAEGQSAHLEATLTPVNDVTMKVEWFYNGRPIPQGHRFRTTYDFGYVALDILYTYPEDSGTYMCKATNAAGEAVTTCQVTVEGKQGLCLDTLDAARLEKIRSLESSEAPRPEEAAPEMQKPVFTTPLNNLENLQEGQHAHLECRLEPINDPRLRVEWFVNGKEIRTGHRFRTTHDFGYVALDILYSYPEDSGTYMCRATNELGEAVNTCTIRVNARRSIYLDTQHPEGWQKIRDLESREAERPEEYEEPKEAPRFVQELRGPTQLAEGGEAHMEGRVEPLHDADLRVEFFHNGKPLQSASRFHTTFDFGYVSLDIGGLVEEDGGEYSCRAINSVGEASSSITIQVLDKEKIISSTQHPEGLEAIRQLEQRSPEARPEETATYQKPMFTQPLQSDNRLDEGQAVHLEARLIPVGDPKLKVDWFRNEQPLQFGSRFKPTHDFGYVALDIAGLRPEDEGVYSCRATNELGEAVTTASIRIKSEANIVLDTQHPESMAKLAALEQRTPGAPAEAEREFEKPVFTMPLTGPAELVEGQHAHFQARCVPVGDPSLRFEWYCNGVELKLGSRIKETHDFGFITLDIMSVIPEDAGMYMCKAINKAGDAVTTTSLHVHDRSSILGDAIHASAWDKIQLKEAEMNRVPEMYVEQRPQQAPVFTTHLQSHDRLTEQQSVHLEATVEPKTDPNLRVEWSKNGVPLMTGARLRSTFDFGLVTLDIMSLRGDDSGIYTCRALNLMGEAVSTCTLKVEDKHWLLAQSQRPEALPAIAQLELGRGPAEPTSPDVTFELPVFVSHLNDVQCNEDERVSFECRVEPAKDPNMKIEWFLNGEPMKSGSRFTTHYDFGLVQLEIADTQSEDAGLIVCKATNQKGSAQTSGTLKVKSSSEIFKETGEKPRFVTQIQSVENLQDGDSAHFECQLEPVGDPDMKVEWFHNGAPLRHSSRIKAVSDFGYVLLDIAYGQTEDSGEYECRATNKHGTDSTRATLRCQGRGGVFLDSLQPEALRHITQLEMRPEVDGKPPAPGSQAPKFTKHITEITNMVEGHSAHFEARLTPVHDPDLTVEWYRNGEKLPSGHRFRTFHDFGIVILDILYCYEEDSGEYECRAVNKVGSDVTKAQLKCVSKEGLILTPQIPKEMSGGLEKIQTLEDSSRLTREEQEDATTRVAPRFTVPFNNIDDLREGENAHFEARLTPVDDPKLKTEWYHNGKPMKASSRFRTFCDFGFVILEISPVYPEDSGEFTCRAYNEVGEATSTAVMKCSGKRNIILETQLPKGMETMQKIADLENLGIKPVMPGETEEGAPPQFLTQPADVSLVENQLAHFECRLSPVGDPTMRVEWYHNGRPLSAGSRVRTINDFGYVILEIGGIYQRDAGLYTCKAINKHGEASVSCTLTVKGRQGVVLEPQMPHGMEGIRKLEESLYRSEQAPAEDAAPQPPRFVTEIQSLESLYEGQPAHFDCRVEPVGDPSMRIEWFHNGRPIDVGSRVHFLDDFGFIVLDLDWTFPRDSGEYVCRATNKWGTATTKATLICKAKRDVVLESQLPKGMSGDRLRTLEEGPKMGEPLAPETEAEPPRFVKEIGNVDVGEGETAFFDCKVEPKNDPNLRVEWYRNGVQVQTGHRFRTTFDFGYASLQILGVYPEDGGEYTCRAVNRAGQATCKSALTCRAISSVIMLTQVPKGMKRSDYLMQMEATLKQYTSDIHLTEEDIYDADRKQPPRFVTQIQSKPDLVEMEQTKFQCQLAPVGDPNMKVEWFFNGRPLPYKNRFTPIYDFGYVAMNFDWVYPEDSGEYLCRATNLYGMDETRAIIKTKGKPGIVYESQLPKGMESVKKIQEMESLWNRAPDEPPEEERAREAPVFVTKPEPVTVNEGDWARFCCRVTGFPRPRVMWLINGHTIVNGTRYKLTYDGMWRLDIPKTRQYDHGKIEVVARNSAGEAYCSCEININARQDDYRAVLKNSPKPWYDYDLRQYQSERQEVETERVFEEKVRPGMSVLYQGEHSKVVEEPEWQRRSRRGSDASDSSKSGQQGKTPFASVAKGMAAIYAQKLAEADQKPGLPRPGAAPAPAESTAPDKESAGRAPIFTRKMQPSRAFETNGARFDVDFVGVPPPEITWFREDFPITPSHDFKVTTTARHSTLEIREVYSEDSGQFSCVASNPHGQVRCSANLVVEERPLPHGVQVPPNFTLTPRDAQLWPYTKMVTFDAKLAGTKPVDVYWLMSGDHVEPDARHKVVVDRDTYSLVVLEPTADDCGPVECVAINASGEARCQAELRLAEGPEDTSGPKPKPQEKEVPPKITVPMKGVTVQEGHPATLRCRFSGQPAPTPQWLKDGQPVKPSKYFKIEQEGDTFVLKISECFPEDEGIYSCVATNSAGKSTMKAPLKVTAPKQEIGPTVSPMKDVTCLEGEPARFVAKITGKPTPTATWLREGQVIPQSGDFKMTLTGGTAVLEICETYSDDSGTITCRATNGAGTSEASARLTVQSESESESESEPEPESESESGDSGSGEK